MRYLSTLPARYGKMANQSFFCLQTTDKLISNVSYERWQAGGTSQTIEFQFENKKH